MPFFSRITAHSIIVASLFFSLPAAAQDSAQWRTLGDDLEFAELSVSTRIFFSSKLTFLRTSLARYRVGLVRAAEFGWKRADVKTLCQASRAAVGINSNFFDEQGDPLGLVVTRGIMHQRIHQGGSTLTGVFQASRKRISIVNRSSFSREQALEALQAGPRLLASGQPVAGLRETLSLPKRAGVCIDSQGRLIFFAVSSRFFGLSLDTLQQTLRRPEIDCSDALNLDGGGSVQLYVSGKLPGAAHETAEISITGDDQVPVILALFPK